VELKEIGGTNSVIDYTAAVDYTCSAVDYTAADCSADCIATDCSAGSQI